MPSVGLGTSKASNPDKMKDIIKSAVLKHGYRMIDTATFYENEHIVGEAL
jgi:aldehyde reductase